MKNNLIVILTVLISLALTYHFKAPLAAALFFACMVAPLVASVFYPSLLFGTGRTKRQPQQTMIPLRLNQTL